MQVSALERLFIGPQRPLEAAVAAHKNAAIQALVSAAGVQALAVRSDLREAMIRESFVHRVERLARIRALQNAREFSGQIQGVRVGRIEHHPIDLFRSQMLPGFAAVGRFEKPQRGAGENRV